jgi:hypothetical protein
MRKLSLFVAALCLSAQLATAQMRLPQPSPGASVMQTIGVTDITVVYSRPAVKGREVFGTVVPYGQLWRTGANGATRFVTTTDVMVDGQTLPAGTYSLFSIPTQDEWTLIFNKNATAGTDAYKEDQDALRVKIKPAAMTEKAEHFTIGFTDMTDSTARLNIMWANVRAGTMLMVNTNANANAGVEKAVADKPEDAAVLQAAAGYNLSKNRNLEQALAWADKSIGLKETYRNVWIKSQILAKMNKPAEALAQAQKAQTLGAASNDAAYPFFKDAIAKGVTDYTALLPKLPETGKKKKK